MIFINKGSDKKITFQAVNNNKGILDITGAGITFNLRESSESSTTILQKLNTVAGGGDTQIKTISAAGGVYIVYLDNSDTSNLTGETYYFESFVAISSATYKQSGYLRFPPKGETTTQYRTSGTTAQRPSLPSAQYIGFRYFDTTINSPIWWSGTAWV